MSLQKQSHFLRLILGISATVMLSNSALAAKHHHVTEYKDNAYKDTAPMAYAPKWTGFYVGAGAGMGGWTTDAKILEAGVPITANQRNGGYGGFGTLIAGYDYLFSQYSILAGAFIDGDLGHMYGTASFPGLVGNQYETGSWQVGARCGFAINPGFLPYLSTGYSRVYFSSVNLRIATAGGPPSGLTLPSFNQNGWFVGAGLEGKITSNWSLKGEYRFAFYHQANLNLQGNEFGIPIAATMPTKPNVQTAQLVVIYKI